MLRRVIWIAVGAPLALLLITLALANRHSVRLVLDPFRPDNPVISIVLPFYVYLIAALLVGVILGGIATWLSQARWRRSARQRGAEAYRWHAEADRLSRERERITDPARQLAPANR